MLIGQVITQEQAFKLAQWLIESPKIEVVFGENNRFGNPKVTYKGGENAVWINGAQEILAAIITYLQNEKADNWGFNELAEILNKESSEIAKIALASSWPSIKSLISFKDSGQLWSSTKVYFIFLKQGTDLINQCVKYKNKSKQIYSVHEYITKVKESMKEAYCV